jgi:tripartite-type tricarboxylate transporter receptor subunit TctC
MAHPRVRWAAAAALVTALAALEPGAIAQNYPTKPIRIILPYLGGTEFVGRWLAGKLSPVLGQQVVVDPRVGAGGNLGHELTATAAPDGYTLMLAAPPLVVNPYLNPKATSYNPMRDFVSISLTGTIPSVLVVHPSVPVKTLSELVQLARSHPGQLTYGSGGIGATSHLAGELFKSIAKINIVHVPYKGATFAMVGALSGEVGMVTPAVSAAVSYVNEGRMRALAILDTKRVPSMPSVPTTAEAGMPQFVVVNWYDLMAPAATPRAIVERLNAEVVKVMQAADTKERFASNGADATSSTPEQAAEFLKAEDARWSKVIREAGIKAE